MVRRYLRFPGHLLTHRKKSFLRFRAADAAFVYFVESVPVYIQVLPFLAFRAIECFACLPNAFLLYARKGLDEACKRLRYKFLIQVLSFDEQRLYFFEFYFQ